MRSTVRFSTRYSTIICVDPSSLMTPAGDATSERDVIDVPDEFSSRQNPQQPDAFDGVPFTTVLPELKQHITCSPLETGTE